MTSAFSAPTQASGNMPLSIFSFHINRVHKTPKKKPDILVLFIIDNPMSIPKRVNSFRLTGFFMQRFFIERSPAAFIFWNMIYIYIASGNVSVNFRQSWTE